MQLKLFAITATRVSSVEVTHDSAGWVAFTIRNAAARHWRNIDTLIRQLRKSWPPGTFGCAGCTQQELITQACDSGASKHSRIKN